MRDFFLKCIIISHLHVISRLTWETY